LEDEKMNYEIVESFGQMVREKGIDKDLLAGIIEEIFGLLVKKKFGPNANSEVVVNMEKGDIEIYLEKKVVDVVTDPATEIDLKTANEKSDEALEVGDDYVEIVNLQDFGRRLIVSAKQNLNQRIRDIERDLVYNQYINEIGEIIVGDIYQIRKNEILVNHNRCELVMPKNEQILKEKYRKGDTVRAIVKEVKKNSGMPKVIISRSDPMFVAKLLEIEIPEIYDGIIEIKGIAREAGERSKVAVESHDDRIDAVGACVGMKGVRIHAVVRELNNENIDVVTYNDDAIKFISNSLSPAKLNKVEVDKENRVAKIFVDEDQMSLVIGRGGQNIRLASQLTRFRIDIVREGEPEEESDLDIDLSEFKTELGDELYQKFLEAGYQTAKEVIDADLDALGTALQGIEGLDERRLTEIVEMMKKEFEEE
jgi:N utilization substance protein A